MTNLADKLKQYRRRKTKQTRFDKAKIGKIELVQIALGHKSINSTVSYLSFNTSSIDDAIHAMEF